MAERSRPGIVAAVDLGASSGRVVLASVGPNEISVAEIHRFPNEPVELPDGLHWDILGLYAGVVEGLRRGARVAPEMRSIGVDSWAVDYALLDEAGRLLGNPYHYRDRRTAGIDLAVHEAVSCEELYRRTGTQFLPFNTIYQLAAARSTTELRAAHRLLLIPDLFAWWLAGSATAEETNASTTGLFDVLLRDWAVDIAEALGIQPSLFPTVVKPGAVHLPLRPSVANSIGLDPSTELTIVASHDTASAFVGTPLLDEEAAVISCGTWALVGMELERPVLNDASRAANFTNEAGVDGTIRYLHNVSGLWLLQETLRAWERAGRPADLDALLRAAAELPAGGPTVDPDDSLFLTPGDMVGRIGEYCRRTDQDPPRSRPAVVRCILDSLAAAFAKTIDALEGLAHRRARRVNLVGGGAKNSLLCQLTADATGRPVVAGPAEATAIGNALIQARAQGFVRGDLTSLRAIIRATQPLATYEPRPGSVPVGSDT